MRAVLESAERVAVSPDTPVIVHGERGAGKHTLARYLHGLTPGRSNGPFVVVSSGGLRGDALDYELFGRADHLLADSRVDGRGLVERAHGGTLFLEEVTELGTRTQAKLERILDKQVTRRLGGTRDRPVNVRVIAATRCSLAQATEAGTLRPSLRRRLDVYHLFVPPLRHRQEDVVDLAEGFVEAVAAQLGRAIGGLSLEARRAVRSYTFPGNISELKRRLHRAVILETGAEVGAASLDLPDEPNWRDVEFFSVQATDPHQQPLPLEEVKRRYRARVLEYADHDAREVARLLGFTR